MQCTTNAEVVLQLDDNVLANQRLEKGVEEHHGADFSSANEQFGQHKLVSPNEL